MEAAQAETVAIYAQGAKQEVTLTAAKCSRQSLEARRVAINFQQADRILIDQELSFARGQVR